MKKKLFEVPLSELLDYNTIGYDSVREALACAAWDYIPKVKHDSVIDVLVTQDDQTITVYTELED